MEYSYTIKTNLPFAQAVKKTKDGLTKEGFGILTEIDVKQTLKKKLNVDYKDYVILGACNPLFAYKALQAEEEIGLLLPCNVIVYSKDNQIFVSTIIPNILLSLVGNDKLTEIAKTVEKKLKKAINSLS